MSSTDSVAQSNALMRVLNEMLAVCPAYRPTFGFVCSLPAVWTTAKFLVFFDNEELIQRAVSFTLSLIMDWTAMKGDARLNGHALFRSLLKEGMLDMCEQRLKNCNDTWDESDIADGKSWIRQLSALTRDEERGTSSRHRFALPLSPQNLAQEQWNREQAERDERRDADVFRVEFRRIGEAFLPSALHLVPTHSCIVLIRDMKVVGHFPAPATHTLSPRQHTPHAAPPSSSFVSSPIPLSARLCSSVSQKMVSPTLRTSHSDRTGTNPLSITIPGQAASPLLSPLDSRKKKTKRDDSDAIRFYTPPFNKFRPSSDDPTDRARMKECMVVSPIAQTPLSAESVEEPELDADDVISRNLEMMGRLRGMDGRMAATGNMSMQLSATVPTSAGPTAPTISFVDPLDLRSQEGQKRLGSQYGATTRPVSATVMGVRGPKRMRG
ncbi:hypothetical protein BLNAU_1331 [Blattamonas nauphoetae]|uniref:Uncharacterized protein n=1 Tax=Blattamonas nauphoetae TaxID=2049346 RepID=A0ABQ9YJ27_9EUKA|nr:hypothetical protein BLNAU_1331 [Blattamonas nauphoetae]